MLNHFLFLTDQKPISYLAYAYIAGKDTARLDVYLKKHPNLLEDINEDGESLITKVIRADNGPLLEVLCHHLELHKKSHLILKPDSKDSTPIHHAAQHLNPVHMPLLLAIIPPDKICGAIKTVNKKGYNALKCAKSNLRAHRMLGLLEPLAIFNTLPPLTEIPRFSLDAYPEAKENKELARNLQLAFKITEKLRSIITVSGSHPDRNNVTTKIAQERADKVELLRQEVKMDHLSLSSTRDDILSTLKALYSACEKHKAGNCYEFANSALYLLSELDPSVRGATVRVRGGDHHVFVIGPNANSNLLDLNTLGDAAVVCDIWGVPPFLAKKIPQKLGYYEQHLTENRFFSVTGIVNLNYHRLELCLMLNPILPNARPTESVSHDSPIPESKTPINSRP